MRPDTPIILESLKVSGGYNAESPVCHDIDLVCASGDFIAVLGPNGGGKTTLLKLLIGHLTPFSGEVLLNQVRLQTWKKTEKAKIIAVVSQHSDIAFPFTIAEVVMLGRTPHRRRSLFDNAADYDIVVSAMKEMDVLHLANKTFHECSGGERKRAIIARALAQQPRILLLDEPAAGLDLRHQVALYEKLATLSYTDRLATIVISHDPWLPTQACSWALLVKDGRIEAQGSPTRVLTKERLEELYGVTMFEAKADTPSGATIAVPLLRHPTERL